jgi:hypothetical protein
VKRLAASLASATALSLMFVLWSAGAALAECPQVDRWPSFAEVAPSARTIVVGTIVDARGQDISSRMTLHVDRVLRGSTGDSIQLHSFRSGIPPVLCPGDAVLWGRLGDRFAIALDGRVDGVSGRVNAVAILNDPGQLRILIPGVRWLTLEGVRSLSGLPDTSMASSVGQTAGETAGETAGPFEVPVLGLGLLAGLLAALHRRVAAAVNAP